VTYTACRELGLLLWSETSVANPEHVNIIREGKHAWRQWRIDHSENPDLSGANLSNLDLEGLDLSHGNLIGAHLHAANLSGANLTKAILHGATLASSNLSRTVLQKTILANANLYDAKLIEAFITETDLTDAYLHKADFSKAQLMGSVLRQADARMAKFHAATLHDTILAGADLFLADFREADLDHVDLSYARLIHANFEDAVIANSWVYGSSVWGIRLEGAKQSNLIVTDPSEPIITVDDVEVAHFINLISNNSKISNLINAATSKAVLLLGRFNPPERKQVLTSLHSQLRQKGYLPILFTFDGPESRDPTETITLLAAMSRFIIADITDPSSIPKELEAILNSLAIPVRPILQGPSARPYSMFKDNWKYLGVLDVYRFETIDGLIASLDSNVIGPLEERLTEIQHKRAAAMSGI
jgi:uncharacterized protein YjbI with pentapeptide repeats